MDAEGKKKVVTFVNYIYDVFKLLTPSLIDKQYVIKRFKLIRNFYIKNKEYASEKGNL